MRQCFVVFLAIGLSGAWAASPKPKSVSFEGTARIDWAARDQKPLKRSEGDRERYEKLMKELRQLYMQHRVVE